MKRELLKEVNSKYCVHYTPSGVVREMYAMFTIYLSYKPQFHIFKLTYLWGEGLLRSRGVKGSMRSMGVKGSMRRRRVKGSIRRRRVKRRVRKIQGRGRGVRF